MNPAPLSILLVALGATSVSAKLGSGIRDLVVADWRMSCGACGKPETDELACTLSSDSTNTYPVQCGCPDCPAPLNAFTCDVSATGIAANAGFETILVDGTARCIVDTAGNTAHCEKTCPVPDGYKIYCGEEGGSCTPGTSDVTCQAVQGNGGDVNDLSCECPDPAVCPSDITCTDQAVPPRAVPDANYPIFFYNTNYGTCKRDLVDDTIAICAGNADFCPPAEVTCADCSGGMKTCTLDDGTTYDCTCANCGVDDVCDTTSIDFETDYPSGINFPAGCALSNMRNTLTCPGECITHSPSQSPTSAPTQTPSSTPTQTPSSTPTQVPSSSPTRAPTDPPEQCVETCDDDDGVCCNPSKPRCAEKRNGGWDCKRA